MLQVGRELIRDGQTPVALAIGLMVIVALAWSGDPVLQRDVTTMLVTMVFVVGFYVFVGDSGILSFGHASFMAIGAYVAAWLTIPPERKDVLFPHLPALLRGAELAPLPAAVIAGLAAAAFAFVIGWPLMRISGMACALALFAILLIVNNVASNWEDWTRGTLAVLGVPTNTDMNSALAVAILAICAAYLYQHTKSALRLRSAREDEVAAKAIGVDIARERRIALVLSAFIVGVGGFLFAQYQGSFNADAFYLTITFTTIAMLVIGGMRSLTGAVVGTAVVSALSVSLRNVEAGASVGPLILPPRPGLREVGLAFVMLAILILRPRGLTGGREIASPAPLLRRVFRRAPTPATGHTKEAHERDQVS
jgi:branched-chain amino acid transport system permease protein